MQRPGFWDDSETAARVSAQHAATQRRLETFRLLESDVSDLDELCASNFVRIIGHRPLLEWFELSAHLICGSLRISKSIESGVP